MPQVAAILAAHYFAGEAIGGKGGGIGGVLMGPAGYFIAPKILGDKDKPKMPVIEMPEVPKTTVEEIEAQEEGWAQVMKRSQGRRGTILTEPSLEQIQPYTKRATLLG